MYIHVCGCVGLCVCVLVRVCACVYVRVCELYGSVLFLHLINVSVYFQSLYILLTDSPKYP